MEGLDATFASYLSAPCAAALFAKAVTVAPGIELVPLDSDGHGEQQQSANAEHASVMAEDVRTAHAASAQFESREALSFVARVFRAVGPELATVLAARTADRAWIDASIAATAVPIEMGAQPGPLGQVQAGKGGGHVPFGPLPGADFRSGAGRARVAPLPAHLQGPHVTLFGPADGTRMCAHAMNSGQRKLPGEPPIIAELLDQPHQSPSSALSDAPAVLRPMWGADDEDSRTPLRTGILASLRNLLQCCSGSLAGLVAPHLRAVPIKRVPGLAMPCSWMRVDGHMVPLHLLDLCLHVFYAYPLGERALTFYIPKLENEVEARYLRHLIEAVERELPPAEYRIGSIRVLVILENPRAVFRINEMMDELFPYFAGASLGWHDYVAAAARLFRNDPTYVMPAKADAQIVVRHIRESHRLLAAVVQARGGVAIGGMYGVLPVASGAGSLVSDTMQVCLRGLIRDVLLQLRRGLNGFWIAHPDFVRVGMALVVAFQKGEGTLRTLVHALVSDPAAAAQLCGLASVAGNADADKGLDGSHPLYARALLAAELGGAGATIVNWHADEVRYNSVQALQYLTDWLMGNGCVALPTHLPHPTHSGGAVAVRVMDDLATTERSRWEVALELQHGRLEPAVAIRIAREELLSMRTSTRTAVPWHPVWSPIAYRIWLLLISTRAKFEFATELLLPFTAPQHRGLDAWARVAATSPGKYALDPQWALLEALFDACNDERVVRHALSTGGASRRFLRSAFCCASDAQADDSACAHSCGCHSRAPMRMPVRLAAAVEAANALPLGRFGPLESSGSAVDAFARRVRDAVAAFSAHPALPPSSTSSASSAVPYVLGAQRSVAAGGGVYFVENGVSATDTMQIASLSKPIGTAFALETFRTHCIPLDTRVAPLLRRLGSTFEFPPGPYTDELTVHHLMSHCGLKQHYVHSFALGAMPPMVAIMRGLTTDAGGVYAPLAVETRPDTEFQYSGGGFLVLQHILELLTGRPIREAMAPFLAALGMTNAMADDDGTLPLRTGTPQCFFFLLLFTRMAGTTDSGVAVPRRAFPSLAAGIICSCRDTMRFLQHLICAFHASAVHGSGPISHDTAVMMLGAPRRTVAAGARHFMAADVGTGLFLSHCGATRVAIHQGANEGYRALFVAAYDGPQRGAITVCLAARDAVAEQTIAYAARDALTQLRLLSSSDGTGTDAINVESGPQETRVNRTLKALLFGSFRRYEGPRIVRPVDAPMHANAAVDLCRGAIVEYVSDDTFAAASNFVHPSEPHYDPALFCPEGKVMDSWESVRHNPLPADELILRLAQPCVPRFGEVSTQWHAGNEGRAIELSGRDSRTGDWIVLARVALQPHSLHRFALRDVASDAAFVNLSDPNGNGNGGGGDLNLNSRSIEFVRVRMFPDGGVSRLRLYGVAPEGFVFPHCVRHPQAIAPVDKAKQLFASPAVAPNANNSTASNWRSAGLALLRSAASQGALPPAQLVNVMAGGRVRSVSNQHYGAADAIVSVCPPRGMFDGFETARARGDVATLFESVVVELVVPMHLSRIDIDFQYFVNNNPNELSIEVETGGANSGHWSVVYGRQTVKPFRGNTLYCAVPVRLGAVAAIRVCAFPCGGFNRVRAMATAAELRSALRTPKL